MKNIWNSCCYRWLERLMQRAPHHCRARLLRAVSILKVTFWYCTLSPPCSSVRTLWRDYYCLKTCIVCIYYSFFVKKCVVDLIATTFGLHGVTVKVWLSSMQIELYRPQLDKILSWYCFRCTFTWSISERYCVEFNDFEWLLQQAAIRKSFESM